MSVRKKLEINNKEILLYQADILLKRLAIDEVKEILQEKETVLIFPLSSIIIEGESDKISIAGFKKGEELDKTLNKLKEIISQKNQE
jgi:hypothetical protein